jgi:hypothetical protein
VNPLEQIFHRYAERLGNAPGASQLARLARSSKLIDPELLAHLAELIERLDDVQLVGNDIASHMFEVSHCSARYVNANAFVAALAKRLQRYIDNPVAASNARGDLRERVGWWKTALAKAGELSRWPAIVLTKNNNMNMDYSNG